MTRPTFKNPLVREAVNWAIDRPAIEKPYGYGYGTPGDKILPPALPGSQFEKTLYPTSSPTAADIIEGQGADQAGRREDAADGDRVLDRRHAVGQLPPTRC